MKLNKIPAVLSCTFLTQPSSYDIYTSGIKRNISTRAGIKWEKKKAVHNEILRPGNWFHTTQGLCVESLDAEIDLNPFEQSCHHSLSALNNLLHVFLLWTIILDCYKKEHTWAILAMTAAVRSLSPTCWGETFFLVKFIVGVY